MSAPGTFWASLFYTCRSLRMFASRRRRVVRPAVRQRLEIPSDGKLMPTAAVARLQIDPPWAELRPGCAGLLSLTRARQLKDI